MAESESLDPPRPAKRRVGVLGAGELGAFLVGALTAGDLSRTHEVAFVWNRSFERAAAVVARAGLAPSAACADPAAALAGAHGAVDLVVEVSHPDVSVAWAPRFLGAGVDVLCGSPTAFADDAAAAALRRAAAATRAGLYVAVGALWGAADLAKMADRGSLAALSVTMHKHPLSLKLAGALGAAVDAMLARGDAGPLVLYDGPVRGLCPLAPNNVNTMATAAVAAHSLGFDGVRGVLVADAALAAHVITVDARGRPGPDGAPGFSAVTERYNPAPPGAVTGAATFVAFVGSLAASRGRGAGVHVV